MSTKGRQMKSILMDHGGRAESAFVRCGECGATAEEPRSEEMSDAELTEVFEGRGWTVNPTRCPEHALAVADRSPTVSVYIDWRDWWVGYYRGGDHHYVCLIPCVVLRWPRRDRSQP